MAFVPFVSLLTFCRVRQCALSASVGGSPLLAFISLSLSLSLCLGLSCFSTRQFSSLQISFIDTTVKRHWENKINISMLQVFWESGVDTQALHPHNNSTSYSKTITIEMLVQQSAVDLGSRDDLSFIHESIHQVGHKTWAVRPVLGSSSLERLCMWYYCIFCLLLLMILTLRLCAGHWSRAV